MTNAAQSTAAMAAAATGCIGRRDSNMAAGLQPVLLDSPGMATYAIHARDWPVHDVAATRAVEQRALAAIPHGALMRSAAASVARWVRACAPHARRIWIAAGPGGNGGDGLHAAALLHGPHCAVTVSLSANAAQLPSDAADGLQRARAAGVTVLEHTPEADFLDRIDLAVDALLGVGARPIAADHPYAAIVATFHTLHARVPVLAIDLPSGLDADSGHCEGGRAVRAHATLSLLTLKPGLFTGVGRDHAGQVWVDDLAATLASADLPPAARLVAPTGTVRATAFDVTLPACRPPLARHASHKGSFGDTLLIGGGHRMAGAVWMAARGAQAAGSGRTLVLPLVPPGVASPPMQPEWMVLNALCPGPASVAASEAPMDLAATLGGLTELDRAVVVCGCGGGAEVRRALPSLLALAHRLVLDADALNAIAADPLLQAELVARAGRGQTTILTPHPLEAARLLGQTSAAEVQRDRPAAVRALAARWRCVVALKGSGTLIARCDRPLVAINASGDARLATGGTGDVLAGLIGGLWAREGSRSGSDADRSDQAFDALRDACWLHGAAAQRLPVASVQADELAAAIRRLLAPVPLAPPAPPAPSSAP